MEERRNREGQKERQEGEELADISRVWVDTDLPKEERKRKFTGQLRDTYRFMCGGMAVRLVFANPDITLEKRLKQYSRIMRRETRYGKPDSGR